MIVTTYILRIFADLYVLIHILRSAQQLNKVFIMGDDQKLEMALAAPVFDDPAHKHSHFLSYSSSLKHNLVNIFCYLKILHI